MRKARITRSNLQLVHRVFDACDPNEAQGVLRRAVALC
jgi:hypothetical protein